MIGHDEKPAAEPTPQKHRWLPRERNTAARIALMMPLPGKDAFNLAVRAAKRRIARKLESAKRAAATLRARREASL